MKRGQSEKWTVLWCSGVTAIEGYVTMIEDQLGVPVGTCVDQPGMVMIADDVDPEDIQYIRTYILWQVYAMRRIVVKPHQSIELRAPLRVIQRQPKTRREAIVASR